MKISAKQYAKLLLFIENEQVNQQRKDEMLKEFARILLKNKHKKKISAIERVYHAERAKISGEKTVSVTSAIELLDEEKEKLKAMICEKYGIGKKEVIIDNKVQRKMIGGLVVEVDNEVIDASLMGKIQKISQSLT